MSIKKNIGIIVAMGKELKLILSLIDDCNSKEINGSTFYFGSLSGHNVTVMQCGIGKVNAAIGAMTLLNNFDVDVVVNTGVAGGADKTIEVMDVVFASQIAHHDVWCGPGTNYGEAYGCPKYFESDKEILSKIDFNSDSSFKCGLICSGDKFIDNIESINYIKSNYPEALAIDMESASIAQVCYLRKVPFFCLRVISDSPATKKDNSAQYDNFWEDAPKHTFAVLKDLLTKI